MAINGNDKMSDNEARLRPRVLVCGISHKELRSDELAPFVVAEERRAAVRKALLERTRASEVVLLVTCNRCEVYAAMESDDADSRADFARHFIALTAGKAQSEAKTPPLYLHSGFDAVRHLMRVACGCESMILGESQILGQAKNAYRDSRECNDAGSTLANLFDFVLAAARDARNRAGISAYSSSFAAAAIRLIGRLFQEPSEKKVLFVGSGKMTESNARQFAMRSFQRLHFTGRSLDKAQRLASSVAASASPLRETLESLSEYDVVISCTASDAPLITREHVAQAMRRRQSPLCFIDMALPHDVEDAVARLDDVYVFTLDDLGKIAAELESAHSAAMREVGEEAEKTLDAYREHLQSLAAADYIKAWRAEAQRAESTITDKALKALQTGSPPEEVVARLSKRLTNTLLHPTTELIRYAMQRGDRDMLRHIERLLGDDKTRDDG